MMKIILPKLMVRVEKWKWNKEYGIFVSNMGRFLDKDKSPIPIKIIDSTGYVFVRTKHGSRPAHRLVMLTWKPIEDRENFTVDHLDHNKRNNCVNNLEWVTAYENIERAKKDSIKATKVIQNGSNVLAAMHISSKEEHFFKTIDEAVTFLISKNKQAQNSKKAKETIEKNIKNATFTGEQYSMYKWKYI